jgi:hypothetical protein
MFLSFWRRLLAHPWCMPMLAVLGMLMVAPVVNVGLIGDDYIHRALLIGQATNAHPGAFFGLFTFADGQAAHTQALKQSGEAMWWASDSVRLSFWRPLAELTHWLDYQLWPDSPRLMHLHNILWYGLLVAMLGRLYRQLDPDPARAALACLIFTISSLHLYDISWIAARNQLIAGCLTVTALGAYHRWRSQGAARHGWIAFGALVLGLLTAEASLAIVGYLCAYCLTLDAGRPWAQRLRALAPFLMVVVAWRLLYNHLGYGSSGSGMYIDPGADLARFAHALLLRMPTLFLAEVFGVPSTLTAALPPIDRIVYAAGAAVAVGAFMLAAAYFRLWSSAMARFLALGALFALIPVCAGQPTDRLLLNAELGLSAVLAMLFSRVWLHHRQYTGPVAWAAKGVIGLSMLAHLLVFPVMMLGSAALMKRLVTPSTVDEPLSLPASAADPAAHVLLLNPPIAPMVYYYPTIRRYFGVTNPASMQALASGAVQAITVDVLDAATIRLTGAKAFIDDLSRDVTASPFKAGDVVDAGRMTVTVAAVSPTGVPTSVVFHFDRPLSDPQWRIYAWGDKGYVPFALPAPGHSVVLPAADLRKMVMNRLKSG